MDYVVITYMPVIFTTNYVGVMNIAMFIKCFVKWLVIIIFLPMNEKYFS